MSKGGKETVTLLVTLPIAAGIAGGGYWLFLKNSSNPSLLPNTTNQSSDPNTGSPTKIDM
ncbi:hypothetical protein TUMEXPCC7403_22820 [Tumidithrix helvetica PCC 7403]|uniref:hypothetical protein n=1 Tax=Tumidithrix helvetica TaxID=3457545 RepID=UPI003CBB587F